jgi:hypothetical protein
MSETRQKKVASRTVAIALGVIAIILFASLVGAIVNYTAIISGKDNTITNYKTQLQKLTNQENQLATWLLDNETLLSQASKWLVGNETLLNQTLKWLDGNITKFTSQENQLLTWLVGNETLLGRTQAWLNGNTTLLSVCSSPQAENAINYLNNVMFVPSVGLDKEAPLVANNTVWLNDNFIAYTVLSKLDSSRAETIREELDSYGFKGNGEVELFNNTTVEPFRTANNYTVATIGNYTIKEEVLNGSLMPDFAQYADLAFLWSDNLLLQGNITGALDYFNIGMSMWNGTGFLDKAFNSSQGFDTYKVGLALWMAKQLNQTLSGALYSVTNYFSASDYAKMEKIVWTMQDPTNGGIYTGYTSAFGTAGSDTNVETTSICLLYLLVADQ